VLNRLVKPNTWLWMLTGTPASQSPVDAFGLARLVNPDRVPKYITTFRDLVMHKISQFRWVPKPNSELTVHAALQPAIRFTKEQCLDLPEMTYVTRDVPLTAQQQKYYDLMRKEMLVNAAGEQITTVNAAANLNKLLQLSGGAVYSDTGEIVEFDASNRLAVLREVIEESSHKVLIFVPYRHAIDIVAEELKKDYTVDVIHGGVSASKRTEIFEAFQTQPFPRVLVIQPQAASHGVTLHAANTIVYWSPVMSVETYLQANARVHRAGQKNKSTVFHLQGSHVERRLYKMLQEKVDVHTKITDLYGELLG
jgi:SNF2 family DNA or RNA helicase